VEDKRLKTCEQCGKIIEKEKNRNWNEYAKKKYCSRVCSGEAKKKEQVEIKCAGCGKTFYVSPSQSETIYCSRECLKAHHRHVVTCKHCGKEFERTPTRKSDYCGWECFKASRWGIVTCAECGVEFKKRTCEIAKTEERRSNHICSIDCRNKFTSKLLGGDGTWKQGGKYGGSRSRGKDWPKSKAAALERDEWTCQQCGSKENLEVHHWEPYQFSFDNSLDNLVTLCRSCHQDKHREYLIEGFYEDYAREGFWD
jgi:5-methylcytosine-specific restriction endonuclease McrA